MRKLLNIYSGIGALIFILAAFPLAALAQSNNHDYGRQNERQATSGNCANGQAQSCVSGTITRIDGTTVYLSSANGSVRVNDQALWDNNRQDMRLVTGQSVTLAGYFGNNGTFMA